MIRNLVSKLKCPNDLTTLYRERAFRSLSPVQRMRSGVAERASSCSRVEKNEKNQARTLCFSKEYYESSPEQEREEARWRESIPEREDFPSKPDTLQFETLEQYELEAARPRPSKSREVFDAFTSKSKKINQYVHLQPSQMKPYGSQENLYSPMLIRPTNALKCPKKSKKVTRSNSEYQQGQRSYSTSTRESLKFPKPTQMDPRRHPSEHWAQNQSKRLDFSPPLYQVVPSNLSTALHGDPLTFSTPAMRKKRKEEANRVGSTLYKASYSDLVKMKQTTGNKCQSDVTIPSTCTGCLRKTSGRILEAAQELTTTRNLATRSKSDVTKYNPECQDVCTAKTLKRPPKFPYEPQKCQNSAQTKIYLPSKVKLPPPHCITRPEYRDCRKPEPCGPRADQCLEITPRQLPKLVPQECPCVEVQPPTLTPKLERLKFKFVDPPKVVCHVPPCQTPRADDQNPYKYKPLKPYVPKECECVEPPILKAVKMKRLPKCAPEEVCRPVRVCPVPPPCPPRADECYRVVPKKLPALTGMDCPCVEPEPPKVAPPIKRLDLRVPDPPRPCPPPDPCSLNKRADDGLKLKRKKLPKFVPGDCPCEDRPMTDWNLRRLVCEDEPQDCIVPDPCLSFPRADWGCWEYPDEVCEAVDPHCVDDRKPCDPPKKPKPCRKPNVCETASGGPLDYRSGSKRRFSSNSNSSLKLYQQMKINTQTKAPASSATSSISKLEKTVKKNTTTTTTTPKRRTSMELIRMLDQLDLSKSASTDELLLFKPKKPQKIDYKHVLKTIASCTAELEKKEEAKVSSLAAQTLKKPKRSTLRVSSRAISTKQNELEVKKAKQCKAKQTCRKIKPSMKSWVNRNLCPRQLSCTDKCKSTEKRDCCPFERAPVCCQKEDSPYSAFSDNINRTVQPFTQTKTPQWTCQRQQYGFHPVYRKEHEAVEKKKKIPPCETAPKGFLAAPYHLLPLQLTHPYTTKIFQIKFPEPCKKPKGSENCDKVPEETGQHPKITCITEESCDAPEKRRCCFRDFESTAPKRKPPPFPAFSDCLDEEMEDILTECPLDKEKYLKMQPRFEIRPPKLLISPPPSQGKLDLQKEQECIREKLCKENEGVTQTCEDFGEPVKLLKSGDVFKEENRDCLRMEQLKKLGRWPPRTLKSTFRNYSTSMGRMEVREYHALIRRPKTQEKREKVEKAQPKRPEREYELSPQEERKVRRCFSTVELRRRFSSSSSMTVRCKGGKNSKKECPKFTLNNCGRRKSPTTYPACTEPPPGVLEELENLQPGYALLQPPRTILEEYPNQERIDRSLGAEYRKFRAGIEDEGVTVGCNMEKEEEEPKVEVTCCTLTPLDECMIECLKCIPSELPEEEKYCICKEKCCKVPPEPQKKPQEVCPIPEEPKKKILCPEKPQKKPETVCEVSEKPQKKPKPVCPIPEEPKCVKLPPPPPPNPCKKITLKPCRPPPSNLEVLWQKVVNYFKARPNCPQPGDYKKAQLKSKAQKAAEAAGLVAVDPKCIPPHLLPSSKECKVCPDSPKSSTTSKTTKNPSYSSQQRSYSSKSCKNLEEINRLLEEGERKSQKELPTIFRNPHLQEYKAMRMSLDLELSNPIDLADLCFDANSSRTYFGYVNVLPSRENILERAWRISMVTYNENSRSCGIFAKVEKSIASAEDLEKLKTDNLVKELDELLKKK